MRFNAKPKEDIGVRAAQPKMTAKSCKGWGRTLLLTGAESRVLALLVLAKTNKEIARDLGISPATVKRHLEKVLHKLGVRNRVEAAICGLLARGCSAGTDSRCALQAWREARESSGVEWAE